MAGDRSALNEIGEHNPTENAEPINKNFRRFTVGLDTGNTLTLKMK
jgi:hypothetical protein